MTLQLFLAFVIPFITVLIITPFVIKFAKKIGAVDRPNERKVHKTLMPRIGGIAIFIGLIAGYFAGGLYDEQITGMTAGLLVIVAIGILDDLYELSPKMKFAGQLVAACLVVGSGLTMEIIQIPFIGEFELGMMSIPITILWIVGITNAINLIDGLDGLSAGISTISIATIAILAGVNGKMLILTLSLVMLGSVIAFLFYNFYPAKIFMGDTGALLLGYSISVLSLLGLYKSVTLFSFIVPIIILGVPIFDTSFAIIRRIVNKRPISAPDKSHMHHRLLALGFSHRNSVLLIYSIGIIFSLSAILLSTTTMWISVVVLAVLLIGGIIFAELIGLIHEERFSTLLKFEKKVSGKD